MTQSTVLTRRPAAARSTSPPPTQPAPVFVVGTPFSGATALAWALGQHPRCEPVVGDKAAATITAALRLVEDDLLPLIRPNKLVPHLVVEGGREPRTLVVGGPEIAQHVRSAHHVFGSVKVLHVQRAVDEAVQSLIAAAARDGNDLSDREAEAHWRRIALECVEAEAVAGEEGTRRIAFGDLVLQPERTLRRALELLELDWCEDCLWPLRLLTTREHDPIGRAPVLPSARRRPSPTPEVRDDVFHRRLRRLVEAVTPVGAAILVVSRGDESLLRFRGRSGAHFPQLDAGTWAGFYPPDGNAAVAHLRKLAEQCASHLLFPQPALWWLDHYSELRAHLERTARLVACDLDLGVLWELPDAEAAALPPALRQGKWTPQEPDNTAAFRIEKRCAPRRRPARLGGTLWAVTTYYNPARYRTKKENYDLFRARLAAAGVPLLAVELAFGDRPFELSSHDADLLVRRRGGDELWQKERLINIGVRHLPDECDRVAWLDADVVLARNDWAEETRRLLREYLVVQPFSHCVRLQRGAEGCEPASLPFGSGEGELFYGIAWGIRAKGRSSLDHYARHGHTGFAWAARRDLLEQHGLYELNLLGNGDTDIAHAMYGSFDYWALQKLGPRARADLFRWAQPFAATVGRSVAHVDGVLTHLWHGNSANRQYDRRLAVLHEFDPERHVVRTNPDAPLTLSPDAPENLRAWTKAYFSERREDG